MPNRPPPAGPSTAARLALRGPLSRATLRRLAGRALRRLGTGAAAAATAATVYAAAAAEPNLSGYWRQEGDDRIVRLRHVGGRVQAVSTVDGAVILDQRWRRGGTFEGFARAWWADERFVAACPDPSDRAARIEAFERDDRFTLFWERQTAELRDGLCRITRRRIRATVYHRAQP